MEKVKIFSWNPEKGFGFTHLANGQRAFIHISAIEPIQPRTKDLTGLCLAVLEQSETERGVKISRAMTEEEYELRQSQPDEETEIPVEGLVCFRILIARADPLQKRLGLVWVFSLVIYQGLTPVYRVVVDWGRRYHWPSKFKVEVLPEELGNLPVRFLTGTGHALSVGAKSGSWPGGSFVLWGGTDPAITVGGKEVQVQWNQHLVVESGEYRRKCYYGHHSGANEIWCAICGCNMGS